VTIRLGLLFAFLPFSLGAGHAAPVSRWLQTQVLLDRAGFSPGEIDGTEGANTRRALDAFRKSHPSAKTDDQASLSTAAGIDPAHVLTSYTITPQDASGPFIKSIPQDMMEQAKLPGLYYSSVLQELGEKFHCAPALLKHINPSAHFDTDEEIRVPNVLKIDDISRSVADRSNSKATVGPVKVVVSKSNSSLSVYSEDGNISFYAPVTSGSTHDPLPLGNWKVTSVLHDPTFNYNPNLFWDADPADAKAKIPAGPNNPVGIVWIGIDEPHYGIHGTPEPSQIGHSESHGCVRLTNWDISILARLVRPGTAVLFEP
jgi:lipoprotein-anchoring transpeptidase ErfK/SrfK